MPALRSTPQQNSPYTVLPYQSHDLPCLDVGRESGHWKLSMTAAFTASLNISPRQDVVEEGHWKLSEALTM